MGDAALVEEEVVLDVLKSRNNKSPNDKKQQRVVDLSILECLADELDVQRELRKFVSPA